MSYVKTVVDAIKGRIKVESTLGKGSAFIIEIPLGNG
jgi:two-component system phosphate regulon sensor histidine kinase PhoR